MSDRSLSSQTWKRLKHNKGAVFGLTVISLAVLISVFAYVIAPDNSLNADTQTVEIQAKNPGYKQNFLKTGSGLVPITGAIRYNNAKDSIIYNKYIDEDTSVLQSIAVSDRSKTGSDPSQFVTTKKYWLGTDKLGRDILSRLIIGTRVSLSVGLIAVLISLTLGILLGALAGYFRGWVDEVIMWLVNVTWSIPTLLLVFAFTMAMGKGFWIIFIAVGLTMWVNVARLVRGQVMAVKELEYVQAARALGLRNSRIILRHILPNISGPIMVIAASNFASAIIIEAGLSFLGIGVQPPQPSWGLMIKENYNFIITHKPMLALVPGFAIMLLVLAFNLLGNGLRDALDVKDS